MTDWWEVTIFYTDPALGPPLNSLCYISPPSITPSSSFLPFYFVLLKITNKKNWHGNNVEFITLQLLWTVLKFTPTALVHHWRLQHTLSLFCILNTKWQQLHDEACSRGITMCDTGGELCRERESTLKTNTVFTCTEHFQELVRVFFFLKLYCFNNKPTRLSLLSCAEQLLLPLTPHRSLF